MREFRVASAYWKPAYMWNAVDEGTDENTDPEKVLPEWRLQCLVARYLDVMEKRGNEWRFISRELLYDWSRSDTIPTGLVMIGPESPRSIVPTRTGSIGVRDPVAYSEAQRRDPSYALMPTSLLLNPGDNKLSLSEELIAKTAIEDMLNWYARHVDRLDIERVGQMFWPEADIAISVGGFGVWDVQTEDHHLTISRHPPQGFAGDLTEYLAWLTRFTRSTVSRSHNIFNPVVEITSPTTAVSECYLDAHNIRKSKNGGEEDRWGYGRYIDKWEKRNGVWKMMWVWEHWLGRAWDRLDLKILS